MKYYKAADRSIWAFEPDGSQDHLITAGMTPLSLEEVSALSSAPTLGAPEVTTATMRQARLALLEIGKLRDVEDAIDALQEPARTKAKIEWDYAATVEKNSPLIQSLAPALGFTPETLTQLFNNAATL